MLIASSKGDVSKLGGAIAAKFLRNYSFGSIPSHATAREPMGICRLRKGEVARLSAIGPNAIQSALRSLTRSGHWLAEDRKTEPHVFAPFDVFSHSYLYRTSQTKKSYLLLCLVSNAMPSGHGCTASLDSDARRRISSQEKQC